jgi:hypothetical protein
MNYLIILIKKIQSESFFVPVSVFPPILIIPCIKILDFKSRLTLSIFNTL